MAWKNPEEIHQWVAETFSRLSNVPWPEVYGERHGRNTLKDDPKDSLRFRWGLTAGHAGMVDHEKPTGTSVCVWCGKSIAGRRKFCLPPASCWSKWRYHNVVKKDVELLRQYRESGRRKRKERRRRVREAKQRVTYEWW